MKRINELRLSINEIDEKLLDLIVERLRFVHEIGIEKRKKSIKIKDKTREKEIIDKLKKAAELKGIKSDVVKKIWKILMETSYEVEGEKNGNN